MKYTLRLLEKDREKLRRDHALFKKFGGHAMPLSLDIYFIIRYICIQYFAWNLLGFVG
jgi:hypothetical protein